MDIILLGSKKIEVDGFFLAKFERADEWGGMCPEPLRRDDFWAHSKLDNFRAKLCDKKSINFIFFRPH